MSVATKKKALAYGVTLVVALFLFYTAENFEFERIGNRIGPNFWPMMILGLLIVVSSYGLVTCIVGNASTTAPEVENEEDAFLRPPEIHPHLVWIGIAATIIYLIAMPIVGFFLGTIPFAAALVYLGQYRQPYHIVVLSVGLSVAFMFLFMRIVYVALPIGIEPFANISIAVMSLMGVR